jgi:hypothetical protein
MAVKLFKQIQIIASAKKPEISGYWAPPISSDGAFYYFETGYQVNAVWWVPSSAFIHLARFHFIRVAVTSNGISLFLLSADNSPQEDGMSIDIFVDE